MDRWRLAKNYRIKRWNGNAYSASNSAVTLHFFHALKGDKLKINNENADVKIVIYSMKVKCKYIYTNAYDKEENWASYAGVIRGKSEYTFKRECYFRIWVDGKRKGFFKRLPVGDKIDDYASVSFISRDSYNEEKNKRFHKIFDKEIKKTSDSVNKLDKNGRMNIFLISDTHTTVNGTFKDTVKTMKEVADKCDIKALVHLGDTNDGLMPYDITKDYVEEIFDDMHGIGVPLEFVRGNHDYNYFKGNPDKLGDKELDELYGEARHYKDYDDCKLRMIFLDCFNPFNVVRYGFSDETLDYLEMTLNSVPKEYSVIICCHIAPSHRLNFYGSKMRGEARFLKLVNNFKKKKDTFFMGVLSGHNHGDRVDFSEGFPIVSIGAGKCESFAGYKPKDTIPPERKLGHYTQELWDVVTIDTDEKKLYFTRFGGGEDKVVDAKNLKMCD